MRVSIRARGVYEYKKQCASKDKKKTKKTKKTKKEIKTTGYRDAMI